MFGGAVLSIHVGDTAPKLVAGASGGVARCRVGDKCTRASDCCDPTNASINGFCTAKGPQ